MLFCIGILSRVIEVEIKVRTESVRVCLGLEAGAGPVFIESAVDVVVHLSGLQPVFVRVVHYHYHYHLPRGDSLSHKVVYLHVTQLRGSVGGAAALEFTLHHTPQQFRPQTHRTQQLFLFCNNQQVNQSKHLMTSLLETGNLCKYIPHILLHNSLILSSLYM